MIETGNDERIQKLAKLMRKAREKRKRVMILAGSGISKSAGIPSFDEIISEFKEKSKRTEKWDDAWEPLPNFDALSIDKKTKLIQTSAWKETIDELNEKIRKAEPTESHKIIANLCKKGYIGYIFSLNYDDLFEKAFENIGNLEVIKLPERMKYLLSKPKNSTHLIKAHGDSSMAMCLEDGYVFSNDTKECERCGKKLVPHPMIPDSAKKHAEYFIDELSERAKYFDIVISVGFSGRYDQHIVDTLKKFQDSGAMICNIDPEANKRLPDAQIKIPDEADNVFQKVEKNLKEVPIQSLDLEFTDTSFFDPIYKTTELTDIEKKICYDPKFKRLRRIHQLGLKYCKYIGARHTRFEHSLGTMRVADEMYLNLRRIDNKDNLKVDDRRNKSERQFLRLAALLHDIGHVWFGHLGEDIIEEMYGTRVSHETLLLEKAIKDLEVDLDAYFENTPYSTNDLINLTRGKSNIDVLDKIIKSTFDADKIEYLLRDSRMTGREYGIDVDKDIFFRNLIVDDDGILYIKEDVVSVLERIAEARYHMYKEVYFDFDVRCYETLFKEAFKTWMDWNEYSNSINDDKYVDFLLMDDNMIFQEMENDLKKERSESIHSSKYADFLERVIKIIRGTEFLPQRVLITLKKGNKGDKEMKNILEEIGKRNASTDFHCRGVVDTHHFSPYKKEEEAQILVQTENGYHIKSLSDCSPFIKGFQSDEGYHEYNVRICFLDITMKDMVMENIKSLLDGASIEYEVKKYGFEKQI